MLKVNKLKFIAQILAGGIAVYFVNNHHALGQEHQGSSQSRYLWIQVPFSIVNPGLSIGGDTNCYGGSTTNTHGFGSANLQQRGNGFSFDGSGSTYGSSYGYAQCTNSPSIQIPSSINNKVLSVHVDCQEKTYDAKGDGKGWGSWGDDQAVYVRALAACQHKEQGTASEDIRAKWKEFTVTMNLRRAEEQKLIVAGKYNLDSCITLSLANIESRRPFLLYQPKMVGLSSQEQIIRYISLSIGSLENGCKQEIELRKNAVSEERVQIFWEKIDSDLVQKAR